MDGDRPRTHSPLPIRELEAQITELAGHLNAAKYRWLTLIAEFDRRAGWNCGLTQSCAHWLNWKCGINLGAAREQLRTAHHTEQLVKYHRRETEREELSREEQQHVNRSLTYWYDHNGSLVVKGRLPAATGAMLVKAIEAAQEQIVLEHVSAETPHDQSHFAARRADAVSLIAQSFLKGSTGTATELVVHVDERTLREKSAGRCQLEDGPSVSAETALRRRPPHPPLGRWRGDEAQEPGHFMWLPSPQSARGQCESDPARRRRRAVHSSQWRSPGCPATDADPLEAAHHAECGAGAAHR
jgi:hypothetical protein